MLRNGFCAVKRDRAPWSQRPASAERPLPHGARTIYEEMIRNPLCVFYATSNGDSIGHAIPRVAAPAVRMLESPPFRSTPHSQGEEHHDVTPTLLPSRVVVRVFRVRPFHRSRHAAPRIAIQAMSRVVPILSCCRPPDFRCRAAHSHALAVPWPAVLPFSSNGNLHGQFHAIPGGAHHAVRLRHHLDRR